MPPTKKLSLSNRRYHLGGAIWAESLKYFAGWIIAAVVLALLAPIVISQFRSIEISAWYIVANVGKVFTAIIAGGFLFTLLPITVANGLTRREFATSMGLFGLLWSASLGVIATGFLLAEHAVYGLFAWPQALQGDQSDVVLASVGDVLNFSATYPLSYAVYFTGGALVGAAIYRSDAGWLTLAPAIPIALAVDDALSSTDAAGPAWLLRVVTRLTDGIATWPAVAIAVAVIAVGAWIARGILLGTPIRGKEA
ncbi:hypothetical protein GCM10027447_19570 [Glycomyces halotolerans]